VATNVAKAMRLTEEKIWMTILCWAIESDDVGFIRLTPDDLARVFRWSVKSMEELLERFQKDRQLIRLGETGWYYYVAETPTYLMKMRRARRLEYQRRWDRKHRPSGWKRWKARCRMKNAAVLPQPM
jgi:hypothetical protein